MDPLPRLGLAAWLYLAAALLAYWAANDDRLPSWAPGAMVLVAIILGAWASLILFDWLTYRFSWHTREISMARQAGPLALAGALRGLDRDQLEIIATQGLVPVVGTLGQEQFSWTIKALAGDIPLECWSDWLLKSQETYPYSWPVWRHDVFSQEPFSWGEYKGYGGAEKIVQRCADLAVDRGWAEPAAGTHSARLKVPLPRLLAMVGLDPEP